MNISKILNNDDDEDRVTDEAESVQTASTTASTSRPGSPGKRPRDSPPDWTRTRGLKIDSEAVPPLRVPAQLPSPSLGAAYQYGVQTAPASPKSKQVQAPLLENHIEAPSMFQVTRASTPPNIGPSDTLSPEKPPIEESQQHSPPVPVDPSAAGFNSRGTPGTADQEVTNEKKGKSKRSKAKNSTWTIEDDRNLVDLVMSTLPTQDFAEYARILNKRDSQTVRYRWKVILRRAKGEGL